MLIIFIINTVIFGLGGLAWHKRDWINFLIKFSLIVLTVVNGWYAWNLIG